MSLTLEDLKRLYGERAVVEHFEKRYPQSYEYFLKTVHACINRAVVEAQRAAQHLFEAYEDHITTFIVSNLRSQQLDADHDSDSGGHVNIFIEDTDKKYNWAAEAKIDTDWPWIEGGVGQLMKSNFKQWDLVAILSDSLPSLRNQLAHGGPMLARQVLGTLELVAKS